MVSGHAETTAIAVEIIATTVNTIVRDELTVTCADLARMHERLRATSTAVELGKAPANYAAERAQQF